MSQEIGVGASFLAFRPARPLARMSVMSSHEQKGYPGVDQLLRLRDVAELLALSEPTVRRLAKNGALPSVRIGAAIRYRQSDVRRLIASDPEIRASSDATEAGA